MNENKSSVPKEAPFYCLTCKRITTHTLTSIVKMNVFCEIIYTCSICGTEKKVKAQKICY